MPDSIGIELTPECAESVAVLKAFADPVRWTILAVLAETPRCVCRLQDQVPIPGNLMSYHLKVLREAGLVTSSRRGRWIDYSLAENAFSLMASVLPGAGCVAAK